MIQRTRHMKRVRNLLTTHPVVAILGARQVGKTTLAREYASAFPRSFLSASEADSVEWRRAFVQTFVERDLWTHSRWRRASGP